MTSILTRCVDLLPWKLRNHVKSVPLLAATQRWLVARAMSGKEFVHRISAGPAAGLTFRVTMPDDKLYWTGTWEPEVTATIASLVRPGTVCCDVGGHRGFMAGVMACSGGVPVYCFEPNPAMAETVADLKALNPQLDIRLLQYAVGAEDGDADFAIMPEASMGKLVKSSFQRDVPQSASIRVPIRTLDGLVDSGTIERPHFIKIDVEGAELDVLSGARRLLERHAPMLLVELHSLSLATQCRELLRRFGYEFSFIESEASLSPDEFRVCHLLAVKT